MRPELATNDSLKIKLAKRFPEQQVGNPEKHRWDYPDVGFAPQYKNIVNELNG
jgi:hypothetical protein